jgi:hypothetical protein
VRIAIEPTDPVPGLVLAAPALLFATLVVRRRELRWPLLAVVLFVVGIGATIYPDGGSLQWGGRYLSPMVPLLAAVAALGVEAALTEPSGERSRWLPIGVVSLLLVQAGGAIVMPDAVRRDTADAVAAAVSAGPDVLVANGGQIARLDLDGWPDRCWVATPDGAPPEAAADVLEVLADAGVRRASFVGFDEEDLRGAGLNVDHTVPGVRVSIVEVGGQGPLRISEPYRCTGE